MTSRRWYRPERQVGHTPVYPQYTGLIDLGHFIMRFNTGIVRLGRRPGCREG